MINRSQLKFHETFQPELSYIAKLLDLAGKGYSGDKFQISEITGIPTGKQKGKVDPHIKYAAYMGLIRFENEKGIYTLNCTEVGNEVLEQDPFVHEKLSKWLCHCGISRINHGAPQWYYTVHLGHSGFYRADTSAHHLDKANTLFSTSISFEEMFGVVRRSYSEGFFSSLNYLKWDEKLTYLPHNYNPEMLFLYAFSILECWDRVFSGKKEISFDDLNRNIEPGKTFNLNEEEIDSILNEMSYEGIVILNRQLYPTTIVRTVETSELVPKLYSRLL